LIVIKRSHYDAPAFPTAKTFARTVAGATLCMSLTYRGHQASSDCYHLKLWNPRVPTAKRKVVTCDLLEDRTGKWFLGHKHCPVPPAVHHEITQLIAELDDAVRREGETAESLKAERREAYTAKKEARVERLEARAAAKRGTAESLQASTRQMSDVMAGTPILIGHHSEKRHRRDLARMDKKMGKAVELTREAARLERRAAVAESSKAISSDDPDALDKLEAKAISIEEATDRMVGLNKALGRKRRHLTPDEVAKARVRLLKTGVATSIINAMLTPDDLGRYGFPGYALTNNRSEVRRIRQRIEDLKKRAYYGHAPPTPAETYGNVRLAEEENRLRIFFPGKPPEEIRKSLKSHGFRWSPTAEAWQRQPSSGAWYHARRIVRQFLEVDLQKVPAALKGPGDSMSQQDAHDWLKAKGYQPEPGSSRFVKPGMIGRVEFKGNQFTVSEERATDETPAAAKMTPQEHQRAMTMGGPKLVAVVEKLAAQTHKVRSEPVTHEEQVGSKVETWPTFNVYRGADFLGGVQKTGAGKGWVTYRDDTYSPPQVTREKAIKELLVSFEVLGPPKGRRFKAKKVPAAPPSPTNQWGVLVNADTGRARRHATKAELFDAWKRQAEKYDQKTGRNMGLGAFQLGAGTGAARVRLEAVPYEAQEAAIAAAYRTGEALTYAKEMMAKKAPPPAAAPTPALKPWEVVHEITLPEAWTTLAREYNLEAELIGSDRVAVKGRVPSWQAFLTHLDQMRQAPNTSAGDKRSLTSAVTRIRNTLEASGAHAKRRAAVVAAKKKTAAPAIQWGTTKRGDASTGIDLVNTTAGQRYMSLTLADSKMFKTVKGAARWLDVRGYNPDGTRHRESASQAPKAEVVTEAERQTPGFFSRAPDAPTPKPEAKVDPRADWETVGEHFDKLSPERQRAQYEQLLPREQSFEEYGASLYRRKPKKAAKVVAIKPGESLRELGKRIAAPPAKPKKPKTLRALAKEIRGPWTQEILQKLRREYEALSDKLEQDRLPEPKTRAAANARAQKIALELSKLQGQGVGEYSGNARYHKLLGHLQQMEAAEMRFLEREAQQPPPAPKKKARQRASSKPLGEQKWDAHDVVIKLEKRRQNAWHTWEKDPTADRYDRASALDRKTKDAEAKYKEIDSRWYAEQRAQAPPSKPAPPAPAAAPKAAPAAKPKKTPTKKKAAAKPKRAATSTPPARGTKQPKAEQLQMFGRQLELFG